MQQLNPRKKTVISFHLLLLFSLETPSLFLFKLHRNTRIDPLGSIQLCLYYVKQMNAFPILTMKIMSSLTGAWIINSILYATVKTHVMLRIRLSFLNEEPDENLQINFSLLQKFLFLSPVEEARSHCLTNTDFSLEMLEKTSRLGLTPETKHIGDVLVIKVPLTPL